MSSSTFLSARPLSGKQCVVYGVEFPAGDRWAVRIPVHMAHLPAHVLAEQVETEARLLRQIEAAGFAWAPRLAGYHAGFDNPIAFPFLALT